MVVRLEINNLFKKRRGEVMSRSLLVWLFGVVGKGVHSKQVKVFSILR